MSTQTRGILLVLASTLFTAAGQILFKSGSMELSLNPLLLVSNYPLLAGFTAYGVGALMLILALRHGELSVLYPIYALNFVWVSVLSPMFFQTDSMNMIKWGGIVLIIAGVSVINSGGERRRK